MWLYYLKTAWRSFKKYPIYSGINLAGLALGMAASFVLILFASQELSYDKHVPDGDRIYRIACDFYNIGGLAQSQQQMVEVLPDICPQIETSVRFSKHHGDLQLEMDGKQFVELDALYAQSSFFEMFPRRFIEHQSNFDLNQPNQMVVSQSVAKKLFGNQSALGKTISVGPEKKQYEVTGVTADLAKKTHIPASLWMSLELPDTLETRWTNATYYNYVKLHESATVADLDKGLQTILRDYAHPTAESGMAFQEWSESTFAVKFFIQPLYEIYLNSRYLLELKPGGNKVLTYALGLIGLFIILIATANYLNLTTARAGVRAKEVGVKKTLGILPSQLCVQFILESILFSCLAMLAGIFLIEILRIVIEQWTGVSLIRSILDQFDYLMAYLVFAALIGLLAGLYPAFYLARFRPTDVIKGVQSNLGSNLSLRNGLVVLQFSMATILIFACIAVYAQLSFMQQKDLGLNQAGIMLVSQHPESKSDVENLKTLLSQNPSVKNISVCERAPTSNSVTMSGYQKTKEQNPLILQTFPVDEQFIPLMEIEVLYGRNFSRDLGREKMSLILNESAVAALELENPIGTMLNEEQEIVGVVHDFHYQALTHKIEPTVLQFSEAGADLLVKLDGQDLSSTIAAIEKDWSTINSEDDLNYSFLDDNFAKMAEKENILGKSITLFTFLAIVIACLGLFGLVAFTAQQRKKEISIRKILGASVTGNVLLLTKKFLSLIFFSLLIALPIAAWSTNRWLEGFAYRINLGTWIFFTAVAVTMVIALLTVSLQSIRAASVNPVDNLRNE